jgi:prophage maintenance system killer protein
MKELIKSHSFSSGNRRTAFIATKYFILKNKGKFKIKDDENNAKIMQGIRENYYSLDEIKEWIKNGEIRPFKR